MAELGTCGACRAFIAAAGARGRCHLRPEMGEIPASLPRCPRYVERGTGATWTPPRAAGAPRGDSSSRSDGSGRALAATHARPAPQGARPRPTAAAPQLPATLDLGGDDPMDTQALRTLLRDILHEEGALGAPAIAPRFAAGTMVLRPEDPALKAKELPLATFFHKVVMVRDRLRVMEQKLNAHPGLSDADKVELQGQITRIYGSLTTFNVLFADRDDGFTGA